MSQPWTDALHGDPLPWLLEETTPAVRHLALRQLLDRPECDAQVVAARDAAMQVPPLSTILAHQQPEGFWAKPGAGYSPKFTSTVWQLIFLGQLGADPTDSRVRAACAYVLAHTQAANGGFGASGVKDATAVPPDSRVIHCLTGNLLRALLGFGWLDDERVQRAIAWQARAVTGQGEMHYDGSATSGPGFCCVANDDLPCAWGATKALLGFARIPVDHRSTLVNDAVHRGIELVLNVDPATAAYPMGYGNTSPSRLWFKLGFPSAGVADVLQVLEAVCELGLGGDPRIDSALTWLRSKQDAHGRWKNEYAYAGRLWADIESQGQPSKWVTLRACRVLRLAHAARVAELTTTWPRS